MRNKCKKCQLKKQVQLVFQPMLIIKDRMRKCLICIENLLKISIRLKIKKTEILENRDQRANRGKRINKEIVIR